MQPNSVCCSLFHRRSAVVGMRLGDKVALITRGYGGMGRASTKLFAREGATVFVAGRNRELGDASVVETNGGSGKADFAELDMVNQDQWDSAVARVKQEAGALHVLMNIVGSNALSLTSTRSRWRVQFDFLTGVAFRRGAVTAPRNSPFAIGRSAS